METQAFDIKLINYNSQFIFSHLPEQAKNEMNTFLQYIVYKYNVEQVPIEKIKVLKEVPNGVLKPSKIENFIKYSREELHER